MGEKKDLQSKISCLQRKNAELFMMADAVQSFATAKSVDQVIDKFLEFCSQLTGARKLFFISEKWTSKKLEDRIFEIINPEEYSFSFKQTENLGFASSFNQLDFKEWAKTVSNCAAIPLRDGLEGYIVMADLPLPEKSQEYVEIVSKMTDPFVLALKEKEYSAEHQIMIEFLRIANIAAGTHELVKETVNFFQKQSGCEAIGIRLKNGDDYPYYETRGFPPEHVLLENKLCARDQASCIIRDFKGDPVIECMCGNIVCGRFNPEKKFFTQKGSFWTNDTTQLLKSTIEADRQANTRNRCNGEGYESVALLALRIGDNRLGLLQLNDKRKNMFTLANIQTWERIADHLALALSKAIAEERLENYSKNLETIVDEKSRMLRDSERLATIGATAGMVGHDIRNPLQAIISDIYLTKAELASIPDSDEKKNVLESLTEIEKNIDYINKIVADLQDFARPLNPNPEETDLRLIIEDLLAKNVLPNNVKVSVNVENSARKVLADSTYLNRIMYNLVNNAVQAMPQGGKLTIQTCKEANDVIITVQDTGVGIPNAIKSKLFTPMFTTKAKGQGFGLAVIKRMTEALGGTVSFESQEGKGTTFTVRLPPQKSKDN